MQLLNLFSASSKSAASQKWSELRSVEHHFQKKCKNSRTQSYSPPLKIHCTVGDLGAIFSYLWVENSKCGQRFGGLSRFHQKWWQFIPAVPTSWKQVERQIVGTCWSRAYMVGDGWHSVSTSKGHTKKLRRHRRGNVTVVNRWCNKFLALVGACCGSSYLHLHHHHIEMV